MALRQYQKVQLATPDFPTVARHVFALMLRNVSSDGYVFTDPTDPNQFSRPGCIIASPSFCGSLPTVDQDYVFNWTRDAAVTAMELAGANLPTSQPLIDYVTFARTCQNSGPIGYGSYTIEGKQRPGWSGQSDGPALQTRAILQMYAKLDPPTQTAAKQVIAANIGYLLNVYQQPTESLWEERNGYSFFARAVQLRCFTELANNQLGIPVPVGVTQAISWLQARLPEHWNSTENIYVTFGGPASTQNPPLTPGYDPNIDIIMASIYGAIPCTDTRLLATAARIRSQWTDPASPYRYPINSVDETKGVGPLLGRYPDDTYDGDSAPPNEVGHPWVPCTAFLAELCYRLATVIRDQQTIPLDALSAPFFGPLGINGTTAAHDATDRLDAAGDRMLAALILHSDHLELSEQFDRSTGFEKSVANLTWSYAAFLSAVRARTGTAVQAGPRFSQRWSALGSRAVKPQDFTLILQGLDDQGRPICRGLVNANVIVPCRVQILADPAASDRQLATTLTEQVWSAVTRLGSGGGVCGGPCGEACSAMNSPVAHNLLVVVAGASAASAALESRVNDWLARGFAAVGVVADGRDPQVVLPSSMRSAVALRYRSSIVETADEIVDLLILAGEERRAFISYAHTDGLDNAQKIFDVLAHRRFDVYLDRFRTAPSMDFVERIDDELRDKAMVVVVETPKSIASTWVMQEIMTAKFRRYGLLAVNIGKQPEHPEISAGQRLRLSTLDEKMVADAVERHYRATIVNLRARRASALRLALRRASKQAVPKGNVVSDGDRCDLIGGRVEYTMLGSFRPGGLRAARRIAEHGDRKGRRPVLYCPRPTRAEARADVTWLDQGTAVAVVPDGRLLFAAAEMAKGAL